MDKPKNRKLKKNLVTVGVIGLALLVIDGIYALINPQNFAWFWILSAFLQPLALIAATARAFWDSFSPKTKRFLRGL